MIYESYTPPDNENSCPWHTCTKCEGYGHVLIMTIDEFVLCGEPPEDYKPDREKCPDCGGEGRIPEYHIDELFKFPNLF